MFESYSAGTENLFRIFPKSISQYQWDAMLVARISEEVSMQIEKNILELKKSLNEKYIV